MTEQDSNAWTVVVVDDEPDVFRVTQLVLRRYEVLGRPVRLLQCESGTEARECLVQEPSVAVLITDVVMEQDDAGLQLVRWARDQPHLKNTRIVIRTGQPGQAPEATVLSSLDINDYWTKQDLSSQRMQTLLTGLIRSYRDLEEVTELHTLAELELEANRQKLHEVMEQEALFRAVSTSLSAGTILIDHGSILYMNKKSVELLGLAVGEGRWNDVVLPEPLCQAELPEHGEITIAQGSQSRWVDFHTMPIEQGAVRGHLVTLIDVSERRRTEDARLKAERDMLRTQHLKQVGVLASGVAHDLNNLLTVIIGAGLYIQELSGDKELVECAEDITEAGRAATTLAQQLMLYGSGGQALRKPQNVVESVRNSVRMWRARAKEQGVKLSFDSDAEGEVWVEIADSQVQQLVGNLVSNALRATERGAAIQVSVSEQQLMETDFADAVFNQTNRSGRYAVMSFADEGTGMDATTQLQIFSPFFTTHRAGRGLGLATVRGIAERLRAAVFIDTGLGRGTTFKIAVPALSKEDWVGDDQVESSPLKGHRILVLDDAPLVRRQIHRLLKRRGCEVVEAETIEQALDAMHEPIHVAVLDFMLRSTTGDVALVELRSIQPDLPAVLCSGYISPEHHHKTTGFAEVVHKPFTQSELLGALERTIRGGKEN